MRTDEEKDPMVGAFVVDELICSVLIVTSCVNLYEGVVVSKVVMEWLVLGLCDGFAVVGCIDGEKVLDASLGLDVGDRLLGFIVVGLVLVGMGDGIVVGFALVGLCDDGLAVVGCVDGDIVGTLGVAIDELCVGSLIVGETVEFSIFESEESK